MTPEPRCLDRISWDAAELATRHPPRFHNRSKQAAYDRLSAGAPPRGRVGMSRWASGGLPATRTSPVAVRVEPGFFTYALTTGAAVEWHLNFADRHLFFAYSGSLLAQDELQVLEHPILASVREALIAEGRSAITVEGHHPTPVLVTGAERRGWLDTAHCASRPHGLYGNEFARSPIPAMLEALTPIVPPTTSHIIAIEAPAGGSGRYSAQEVRFILETAVTGFAAARCETARVSPGARTVIHTGWWGCGAYGGNRELMALLQLEAAALAGTDELVFHLGNGDARDFDAARATLTELGDVRDVAAFVNRAVAHEYRWGVSNGT